MNSFNLSPSHRSAFAATMPKTNVKRKPVPQPLWLPGSTALMPRLRYPLSKRPLYTPKLQSVSRSPRDSRVPSDQTNCKHPCGLCITASGGCLPHSPEDILQCTEGEQERRLQTKTKVKEIKSWKKPGLCVLLMST